MNNNHSQTPAQDASVRALKKINELLARHWHLDSVGLGNCRAAQAILRELNEQLLIQSASLLANAGFDSNEPRDSHGQWATTGTATNRPAHANTAHGPDHPGAKSTTAKPAPAANHHAEKTPSSTNALGTHAKKTKPPTRIAGIVYNETSGIYPALKPGVQVGGVENWSPESRKALNEAREQIAEIANAREKRVASSVAPNPKHQTPVGKAQWQDSLDAATRAEGKKSDNHFVIWPSTDGKAPTEKPRMQKDWPYDYKKNITAAYGPFRVPIKVGDVPAGSNIYIFFYKDVP